MLQVCADTLIGSDQVRGVSGGQRKRVTTGMTLFMSMPAWHQLHLQVLLASADAVVHILTTAGATMVPCPSPTLAAGCLEFAAAHAELTQAFVATFSWMQESVR